MTNFTNYSLLRQTGQVVLVLVKQSKHPLLQLVTSVALRSAILIGMKSIAS